MKVVAATTVRGPYISARYRCFAESYPEHELTLLEFGSASGDYPWARLEEVVPFRRLTLFDGPVERQPRRKIRTVISRALEELDPDVLVVCGYGVAGMGAALHWAQTRWSVFPSSCSPTALPRIVRVRVGKSGLSGASSADVALRW